MRTGWEIKTLGEVCDISAGQGAPQGEENYCLDGTPFIKAGNLEALVNGEGEQSVQKVSKEVALSHRLVLQKKGSIVFAKSGMSCMKGYIYTLQQDCYVVSHLAVLFPKSVYGPYLNYALHFFKPSNLASDASFPSITLKDLALFPVPFPVSLQEQQRIVDILDKEFAKIDALKANAEKTLQAAKDLFQTILLQELEDAPGVRQVELNEITEICLGLTHTPKYVDKGVPFVSVKDISGGVLDLSTAKRISEIEFRDFPYGAKPKKGDVLFCRVGTIGKPMILEEDTPFGIFVSVGFFRPYKEKVLNSFLKYWMLSSIFERQVETNVVGSTLKNLNTGWLKHFSVPLPPLEHQRQLVERLDNLNDRCKSIQDNYQKTISLCDDLKQSLLRKAFDGEL